MTAHATHLDAGAAADAGKGTDALVADVDDRSYAGHVHRAGYRRGGVPLVGRVLGDRSETQAHVGAHFTSCMMRA